MSKPSKQSKLNTVNLTTVNAPTNNFYVASTGFFLLVSALFFSHNANADTNATGVEIEIISEADLNVNALNATSFSPSTDPIENLVVDLDTQNADSTDLWARIKDGYAMPDVLSQYATNHETWYASRPVYVKRMVERSQKYLFHIVEEVQKRGMPTEIALLPMIESAFNPQAYSRSRAAGIWQFIPSTGKHFGLQQNWWVDNRRDVTAATDAALDYLQKLHGMFGAWDLALAAYNAGEGTVQRAIDRNRNQGLATDYASLNLPAETKNYVPKLQAIKNIITEPEKFGLKVGSIPNRPYFARVSTPKQIDAKLAAQLAEVSYEEFSALNPSYNRPVITSQSDKNQLLLPVWAAERFVENLANYDKPLTNWKTYNAKRGEKMDNIAQRFGMDVKQLRDVNGLHGARKLDSARAILVPTVYAGKPIRDTSELVSDSINVAAMQNNDVIVDSDLSYNESTKKSASYSKPTTYKVKKGDTLTAVANKYDSDAKTLMRINRLKNAKLKAGQILKLENWNVAEKQAVKTVVHKHKNGANRTKAKIK